MNKAKAIVFSAPGQVELREVQIPDPGEGQLLVKTAHSCVSPGTELRCLRGQQADMPAGGYIPGYAAAGTVIKAGSGTSLAEGTVVRYNGTTAADITLMWGGHVELALVNEADVQLVPAGVSTEEASSARLGAIANRGVALAAAKTHHRVAVLGLGPIGQFSARIFAQTGAYVVGADMDARRVDLLKSAGVEAAPVQGGLKATFEPFFPEGADIVVDCTGVPPVMKEAVHLLRPLPWTAEPGPAPKYIIQGSYPGGVELPYQDFFMNETEVRIPRDSRPTDMAAVLDLMGRGKLKVRDLLSEICKPEDAQQAYDKLQEKGTPLLTVAFAW